ncbi:MAG: hypothetical protein ACK55I_30735, partial [bacterium]
MPGFQLVGVDCTPIEPGSQDLGFQIGIGKAPVGSFTPGESPLYVHSLVDTLAECETLSGLSGQVPGCLFEVGKGSALVVEPVHL